MHTKTTLSYTSLLLMISFASVNAVLFTPALPDITRFFAITDHVAQQTISLFLVGYALGQLIYGPIANRFGRKPALYAGIILQILSSTLCVFSGTLQEYSVLVLGRFLLALGSGVGLKMTFTLVNECYPPTIASQKISYLMLAFAITPGLGIALGGVLNTYYGWKSCFYAGIIYGFILLFLVTHLPETLKTRQLDALKVNRIIQGYAKQFKNSHLIICGMLMGGATCFVYVFAAIAPFLAINLLGMDSAEYGIISILPTLGLMLGSVFSARFAKKYSQAAGIKTGILIASIAAILMAFTISMPIFPLLSLFLPMMVIYFGLALIFANASTIAMAYASDKAHGSAVMNFINMGLVTIVVLGLGYFPITKLLLPVIYIIICAAMLGMFQLFIKNKV